LTISETAKRAGVSRDTISNAERGRHSLQGPTLSRIAYALGKVPSELLAEEEKLSPKAAGVDLLLELDLADLEDWASGVDSLAELRPVSRALQLRFRELADYDRVTGGGGSALADALEAKEKRMIIDRRMMELAPPPLATIVMRLDEPTQIIYHRDPTDEERARVRTEYPDAVEIEAKQVALAY
jgi:transcriptional regulator with XRE-family HTH domain